MHELSRFTAPPGDIHCMGGDSSCDRNLNKKSMMAVLKLVSQGHPIVGANTPHHRPSTPTKCLEELLQDRQIDLWGQHRCPDMAHVTLCDFQQPMRSMGHFIEETGHDQYVGGVNQVRQARCRPGVINRMEPPARFMPVVPKIRPIHSNAP